MRAYGIGGGKLILTDKLHCPSPSDLPTLTGVTRSYSSAFTSVKERRIKASVRDPDPPVHIKEEDSNAAIFSCLEEGCVKTFERYLSMQRHLNVLLSDILGTLSNENGDGDGDRRLSGKIQIII